MIFFQVTSALIAICAWVIAIRVPVAHRFVSALSAAMLFGAFLVDHRSVYLFGAALGILVAVSMEAKAKNKS